MVNPDSHLEQARNSECKPSKSKGLQKFLIQALFDGALSPAEIVEQTNVSLTRLGNWGLKQKNIRTLAGLARVADARAQLLLSNYRANAAASLVKIAAAADASDLSRKACVDLLKLNLPALKLPALEEPPPQRPRMTQAQVQMIFQHLSDQQAQRDAAVSKPGTREDVCGGGE